MKIDLDVKQPTQLKHLNLNEISKPLWIEIPIWISSH